MPCARRWLPLLMVILANTVWTSQGHTLDRRVYRCPVWETAVKLTDVEKYSTNEEYVAARNSGYVLEKVATAAMVLPSSLTFTIPGNLKEKGGR